MNKETIEQKTEKAIYRIADAYAYAMEEYAYWNSAISAYPHIHNDAYIATYNAIYKYGWGIIEEFFTNHSDIKGIAFDICEATKDEIRMEFEGICERIGDFYHKEYYNITYKEIAFDESTFQNTIIENIEEN